MVPGDRAVPGRSVRARHGGRGGHQDLAGHPQVDPGGDRVGGVFPDPGASGPAGRRPVDQVLAVRSPVRQGRRQLPQLLRPARPARHGPRHRRRGRWPSSRWGSRPSGSRPRSRRRGRTAGRPRHGCGRPAASRSNRAAQARCGPSGDAYPAAGTQRRGAAAPAVLPCRPRRDRQQPVLEIPVRGLAQLLPRDTRLRRASSSSSAGVGAAGIGPLLAIGEHGRVPRRGPGIRPHPSPLVAIVDQFQALGPVAEVPG